MTRYLPNASMVRWVISIVVRVGLPAVAALCFVTITLHPTTAYSQKRKKCVDCHKDFKKELDKRHVHEPAKDCATCHKRHGFAQKLVLTKGLPALCVDCHEGITEEINSPNAHKALELGGCTICHNPHASDNEGYLREMEDGSSVCMRCHGELAEMLASEDSHKPFREGDCAACHAPHASDQPGLLLSSEKEVCDSCHKNALSKHKFTAAADYACSDCHDPHGSSKKSALAQYAHEPFATGECDICHTMDGGDVTMEDDFPAADMCADCHDEQAELVQGESSHFGTDARKDGGTTTCLECHSPHTSRFAGLFQQQQMDLCFTCHETLPTGETHRGRLHAPYANGECATCHNAHGGGGDKHFAEEASVLCSSCHEGVAAPVTEGQIMHGAMEALECIECHSGHASQNPALLSTTLSATCHSCHEKTRFSVTHAPYGASTCNVCHQNHARQANLLPTSERNLCSQCHMEVVRKLDAEVKHPPAQEESCSLCHVSHGGDHKGLLSERQDELCFGCHDIEDLVVQAPTAGAKTAEAGTATRRLHTPVAEGNCSGCHDAHGSALGGLVVRDGGDLCFSCHTEEKVSFAEGNVHPPVAEGNCRACHTPHGAPDAALRKMQEPDVCTQCHDFAKPPLLGSHKGLDVTVSSCTTCHNPHNSPVADLLNPIVHEPFAEGDCETCHEGAQGSGAIAAVAADICADCHDDKSEGTGHQSIDGIDCVKCHSPHASRHESLLLGQSGLCTECHAGILDAKVEAGQTVTLHKPIRDGSCLDCHKMHDAPGETFLASAQGALCAGCHPSIENRLADKTKHDPFEKGKCSSCHATHASADPHLLKKDEQRLCKSCHRLGTEDMAKAHNNIPLSGEGCTGCHDPHSTQKAATNLLLPTMHPPYEDGDCTTCHEDGGSPSRSIAVCTECHDEKAGYVLAHNAGRTGASLTNVDVCLDCHSPHAGRGRLFRRSNEQETCMQCHDRNEFTRNTVHGALEDGCATCHDVHENNFGALKGESQMQMCADCHEDASMHAHPVGIEYEDPRTGGPLLCTSCHEPHSSDYEHILTFDHRRDLCVQCHQSGTMKVD